MRLKLTSIILLSCLIFPHNLLASENTNCDNRFLTLVNPVRGRVLWKDQSLKPLEDQYKAVLKHDFAATWLLQYDAVVDQGLVDEIKVFNSKQEVGVFLEISEKLANEARVVYPYNTAWVEPQAVFLSGYTQSERRRLVDALFNNFKKQFGYFPQSVGAWWVDSYSLEYMMERYDIKAAMIVADQKTTDNYGVWGQWWGYPYYPSKANILTPPDSLDNKLDVVIIQWAQRDPSQAFGEGPEHSNYSLQANDYKDRGLSTAYFKHLTQDYLSCQNPLGQITVGLETGIESVEQIDEYRNQLQFLKNTSFLKARTMSKFAREFSRVYPDYPQAVTISSGDSHWILTPKGRVNEKLNDHITYNPKKSFADFFTPDKQKFLDRRLTGYSDQKFKGWMPFYLVVIILFGFLAFFKNLWNVWIVATIFSFASYGPILRSYYKYGWQVFYGPTLQDLSTIQVVIILMTFLAIGLIYVWSSSKKDFRNLLSLSILLTFGIDPLLKLLRYSFISGKHYFGIAQDPLRFIGVTFAMPFDIQLISVDLPSYQTAALLRLNFSRIWDNIYFSLFAYPFMHLISAFGLAWILYKLPGKIRKGVVVVMAVFLFLHLVQIFNSDPLSVLPIQDV